MASFESANSSATSAMSFDSKPPSIASNVTDEDFDRLESAASSAASTQSCYDLSDDSDDSDDSPVVRPSRVVPSPKRLPTGSAPVSSIYKPLHADCWPEVDAVFRTDSCKIVKQLKCDMLHRGELYYVDAVRDERRASDTSSAGEAHTVAVVKTKNGVVKSSSVPSNKGKTGKKLQRSSLLVVPDLGVQLLMYRY